jgi:hypothetical protein
MQAKIKVLNRFGAALFLDCEKSSSSLKDYAIPQTLTIF